MRILGDRGHSVSTARRACRSAAGSLTRKGEGWFPGNGGMAMGFLFLVAIVVVALILLYNGIRIVREYQRLVVFRLGRSIGQKGPGVVYLIPIVDRAVLVDLRE